MSFANLIAAQATYDRLVAHRARVIAYYDDCPDGDPRKVDAEKQLASLHERVLHAERELDAAVDALDDNAVLVRIENAYSDGHESTSELELAAPAVDELDAWFDEVVYPLTGDGHGAGARLGSCYVATIIAASDQALVGKSQEWTD